MDAKNNQLMLQTGKGAYKVCCPEDIISISIEEHVCHVSIAGKETGITLVQTTLQNVLETLPQDLFCRIGRDIAVNIRYVDKYEKGMVFLSNGEIVSLPARSVYADTFMSHFMQVPHDSESEPLQFV